MSGMENREVNLAFIDDVVIRNKIEQKKRVP